MKDYALAGKQKGMLLGIGTKEFIMINKMDKICLI
jgi:hypothetical protein